MEKNLRKRLMCYKNNTRGVTLIALVVTIVVLIILATISVGMLAGENGLLNSAQGGSLAQKTARINEDIRLGVLEYEVEVIRNKRSEYSLEDLKVYLIEKGIINEDEYNIVLEESIAKQLTLGNQNDKYSKLVITEIKDNIEVVINSNGGFMSSSGNSSSDGYTVEVEGTKVTVTANVSNSDKVDSYRFQINGGEFIESSSPIMKFDIVSGEDFTIIVEVVINGETVKLEEKVENNNSNSDSSNNEVSGKVEDYIGSQDVISSTENVKISDTMGNTIVIPAGFKMASDSGSNLSEGIVIEDENGNQFVWIPVGDNLKTSTGDIKSITLSRYYFDTSGNYTEKGLDEYIYTGNPGTISGSYYTTEATTGNGNAVATSISTFITNTNTNGGYYIGRYEAGGTAGNVTIKSEQTVYANVTQLESASQSKAMYSSSEYTSDLMNGLAWDTATVYIQTFSSSTNYANQTTKNTKISTTGGNGDEVLKINDLASNVRECITESSSFYGYSCVNRGGSYNSSSYRMALRDIIKTNNSSGNVGFRPIIYLGL